MADTVDKRVEEVALPVLDEMGLELVDVQYRREQRGWVLRLIIWMIVRLSAGKSASSWTLRTLSTRHITWRCLHPVLTGP
jgi:hypothetical protein